MFQCFLITSWPHLDVHILHFEVLLLGLKSFLLATEVGHLMRGALTVPQASQVLVLMAHDEDWRKHGFMDLMVSAIRFLFITGLRSISWEIGRFKI